MRFWLLLVAATLISYESFAQTTPSLRTTASFPVGVAVRPHQLADSQAAKTIAQEFSQLTAENAMKPKYTWLSEHQYDFGPGDSVVAFAQQHNMRVHLSEVDIKANPRGETDRLTPELAEVQRKLMREIVRVYNALPEQNKYAITFWGLRDSDSWLNTFTAYRQ